MKRTHCLIFAVAVLLGAATAQEKYLGEIFIVGFNFCPVGSLAADGQLLAISQNDALFSLLGTMYGGDGRTTFALPDLRGRVPLGTGAGPGLSPYTQGARGGTEAVTLIPNQLPSHSHSASTEVTATLKADPNSGDSDDPTNAVPASERRSDIYSSDAPTASMSAAAVEASAVTTVGDTGGDQAHENRMPYLAIRYCVVSSGIYPPRN